MVQSFLSIIYSRRIQLLIYLFVNNLFIYKYITRVGINAIIPLISFNVFILIIIKYFTKLTSRWSDIKLNYAIFTFTCITILLIITLLITINPLNINVDRWSAVTYFIDNLFQGHYPYGAHTHLHLTNYPSPFPIWYLICLPFYLLGDVGIGGVFFFIATIITVFYITNNKKTTLLFITLLVFSPAYWWEMAVRSDSLSNALLVFMTLLFLNKKKIYFSNNIFLNTAIVVFLSCTRLSAILPLAIFYFRDFILLKAQSKIISITLFTIGVFIIFMPFIFWDTNSWVFFSRNPFMSQGSIGNGYTLVIMILLGVLFSFLWKTFSEYISLTSIFLFIFMFFSHIALLLSRGDIGNYFTNSVYDISYFTLAFPYCIYSISRCADS